LHARQHTDPVTLAGRADRATHDRVREIDEDDLTNEFRPKLRRDATNQAYIVDSSGSRDRSHGTDSGEASASTPAVTNARRASSMSRWL
jgi:hypothetical protein